VMARLSVRVRVFKYVASQVTSSIRPAATFLTQNQVSQRFSPARQSSHGRVSVSSLSRPAQAHHTTVPHMVPQGTAPLPSVNTSTEYSLARATHHDFASEVGLSQVPARSVISGTRCPILPGGIVIGHRQSGGGWGEGGGG